MAYDFMENFDKNNERFKDEISKYIDDYLGGIKNKEGRIVLGETPPVLSLAGANTSLKLVISCEQINHIIDKHFNISSNYEKLNKENVLNIYDSLINPICLLSGSEKDTCVVITDFKNQDGLNIQVPIFFNIDVDEIKVTAIATQYPNRTMLEYIAKEIIKHNLIAANNKKLENLLRPIGLLLPVGHTSYSSYDESISHNTDNVKYEQGERLFKFNTDNKYFKPKFKANFEELNKATNELGWGHATQYFIFGEELSSVRKNEFLWDLKMLKHDTDRHQLENRLIENKTKEIEEKLKEIKSMLNVKEEIKNRQEEKNVLEISIDWEKANDSDSFNSLVVKELKNRNIEYAYDHFFKLRAEKYDLNVNVHTKVEDRTEYIESFETIKNKEKETKKYEEYRDKYSHIIGDAPLDLKNNKREVSNMLEGKDLIKIKEAIREEVKEFIENFSEGSTYEEKSLNCYNYYKNIFEQSHKPNVNGNIGSYLAQDGNLTTDYDDVRKIYGLEIPNRATDEYHAENQELWEIYKKDVNEIFESEYKESVDKIFDKSLDSSSSIRDANTQYLESKTKEDKKENNNKKKTDNSNRFEK